MEQTFNDFLKLYATKQVWFLLPGGLISGTLDLEDKSLQTITLSDVAYCIASTPINLPGTATILCSQISAWGDGSLID